MLKSRSNNQAIMDESILKGVLNNISQIFINAHNMSNTTLPSYKAPSMHPVSVILCLVIALICVLIYGGSALLEFYAKLRHGNRQP